MKHIYSLVILPLVALFFLLPQGVHGQAAIEDLVQPKQIDDPAVVELQNPIEGGGSIQVIIGRAIQVLLGLLGAVTLLMFVDGGFTWLTSGGQSDRVKKGLMTMLYAVIGLFVIFAAYGILSAIITELGTPSNSNAPFQNG